MRGRRSLGDGRFSRIRHEVAPTASREVVYEFDLIRGLFRHRDDARTDERPPADLRDIESRAEQALISVVATACRLGVSTRRVETPAENLGVTQLSKSRVAAMSRHDHQPVTFWSGRRVGEGRRAVIRLFGNCGRSPSQLVHRLTGRPA
ncbi:transposase [Streptomyces swartbergensis]|uniref:transposase n=1 Tax=Streptomyces swartbergensis TaxID=487165 RepID=UPI00380577FD